MRPWRTMRVRGPAACALFLDAGLIPGFSFSRLSGCCPNWERPEAVAADIAAFLARVNSACAATENVMHKIESHFAKSDPGVAATYRRLLETARELGPVVEEPKKTSIHLVRRTAFAGVATRRSSLMLTLKSATDIGSTRIAKREQTSAHRWHVEIRLEKPADVDTEVTRWLAAAYDLAGD